MIGGEFDLSIGSIIGFAGVVIGLGVTEFRLPLELAVLVAFAFAILIGYVNGLLVIRTGLPSFIVTLAVALHPARADARGDARHHRPHAGPLHRRRRRRTASSSISSPAPPSAASSAGSPRSA